VSQEFRDLCDGNPRLVAELSIGAPQVMRGQFRLAAMILPAINFRLQHFALDYHILAAT
jgi:hypothetical protein